MVVVVVAPVGLVDLVMQIKIVHVPVHNYDDEDDNNDCLYIKRAHLLI